MPKEIETRILHVDKDQVLAALRRMGARYVAARDFKRIEFLVKGKIGNVHKGKKTWLRLRTDGKTTTITLKERSGSSLTNTNEWETEIEDFKTAAKILCKLFKPTIYEENKRIEYYYGSTMITLDWWEGLGWLVEIEGSSVATVRSVYKKMKISGREVGNMSIVEAYRLLGIDIVKLSRRNDKKLAALLK